MSAPRVAGFRSLRSSEFVDTALDLPSVQIEVESWLAWVAWHGTWSATGTGGRKELRLSRYLNALRLPHGLDLWRACRAADRRSSVLNGLVCRGTQARF